MPEFGKIELQVQDALNSVLKDDKDPKKSPWDVAYGVYQAYLCDKVFQTPRKTLITAIQNAVTYASKHDEYTGN